MNKIISTAFLAFLLALPADAQEVLTLEKCRQLALKQREELQLANIQYEKARQQQAVARTFRFPGLSASGTGIYQDKDFEMELILPTQKPNPITGELEPNIMLHPVTGLPVIGPDGNPVFNMYAWMPLNISLSGAYLMGVNLEQPVYTGGKISAGHKMANIGLAMASENLSLQRMNTYVAADQAYWTYIAVYQKVKLAQQAVEMIAAFLELARNSADVGLSNSSDLLKAQVEFNNAQLNLQKAINGQALSRMELCRITGLPFNTLIIPADTLVEAIQPFPGGMGTTNPSQRPEIRLLEKNIELQEQQIRMTKSDFLPMAGIQAGYQRIGGIELSGVDFNNTSFNAMASLKIPLFHWGEGYRKIQMARLDKRMLEIELEKNRQLMTLETEQARLNLMLAWDNIQLNELALAHAVENLRICRNNYEVGMETMTVLLMAQTQWQQASSGLIEAKTDFRIKETLWLKVSGRLEM